MDIFFKAIILMVIYFLGAAIAYHYGYANGKRVAYRTGSKAFKNTIESLSEAMETAKITEDQMKIINSALRKNYD